LEISIGKDLSGNFRSKIVCLKLIKTACLSFFKGKQGGYFLLCGRRDSNPHAVRHQILSLARLPIPPRPLNAVQMYVNYFTPTTAQRILFE
jgi:hypothetical protein